MSPEVTALAPLVVGERRVVTIVFTDVSGFTAMSERLDHERVNQIMRECWGELDPVVTAFGGTVDKHIGDALMATFGAQRAHEDDPLRAVLAGLALQRRLHDFSARLFQEEGLELRMRCGIAMGEVTVDRVADSTQELSVIGPAVNLASRLEHECTLDSVYVNREVFRATEWAVDYHSVEPRPIKGIAGLAPIYEPIALREVGKRQPDRASPLQPGAIVGRSAEQEVLQQALAAARQGQGPVVALVGEAGIGKTALASWLRTIAESAGVRWVGGRSLSYDTGQAYALIRAVLRDMLNIDSQTSASIVHERLVAAIASEDLDAGPGHSRIGHADLTDQDRLTLLERLLLREDAIGSQAATPFISVMEPRARRRLTVQAIADLFVAQAKVQPLVVSLEDLHWSDEQSLDVAQEVAARLQGSRCLMLLQSRPGVNIAWLAPPYVRIIEVGPLPDTAAGPLARALLQQIQDEEPAFGSDGSTNAAIDVGDLTSRLSAYAHGNPYFLIELVRNLVDYGQLAFAGGAWRLAEGSAQTRIPTNVRRLLTARIDTLEISVRRVLEEASVIGQRFSPDLLAQISERKESVQPSLQTLLERQFVKHLGGRADSLSAASSVVGALEFEHNLLRDTAYESLSHVNRQRYHRRTAEVLEQQLDLQADPAAIDILAHHFTQSDRNDRAIKYALQAAEHAAEQFANREALRWCDEAGFALDRLERQRRSQGLGTRFQPESPVNRSGSLDGDGDIEAWRVRLLESRAGVENVLGQFSAAREHLEEALGFIIRVGALGAPVDRQSSPSRAPELYYKLARVHEAQGNFDAALSCVHRGLEEVGAVWDREEIRLDLRLTGSQRSQVMRLCTWAGLVNLRRTHFAEAEVWARRAMELAETGSEVWLAELPTAQAAAQAHNLMGVLLRLKGRPTEAAPYHRESIRRYEALDDVLGAELAHTNLGVALRDQGNLHGAREEFEHSHGLAQRTGESVRIAAALINRGEVLTAQGDWEEARRGYEQALEVVERLGQVNYSAICRMNLAYVYVATGDGEHALQLTHEAEEIFTRIGATTYTAELLRYRALAELLLGRQREALSTATRALARARELGRPLEEARCLRVVGQTQTAQGVFKDLVDALQSFTASEVLLEGLGAQYDLALTLLEETRALVHLLRSGRETHLEHVSHHRARHVCTRAVELFRTAGATRDLVPAQALLAQLSSGGLFS